jgi:hypothetical protein
MPLLSDCRAIEGLSAAEVDRALRGRRAFKLALRAVLSLDPSAVPSPNPLSYPGGRVSASRRDKNACPEFGWFISTR